jgi:hypothetical protein
MEHTVERWLLPSPMTTPPGWARLRVTLMWLSVPLRGAPPCGLGPVAVSDRALEV